MKSAPPESVVKAVVIGSDCAQCNDPTLHAAHSRRGSCALAVPAATKQTPSIKQPAKKKQRAVARNQAVEPSEGLLGGGNTEVPQQALCKSCGTLSVDFPMVDGKQRATCRKCLDKKRKQREQRRTEQQNEAILGQM